VLAPPECPIIMPMSAAASATATRCHVRHDRRSLICSSPGDGGLDSEAAVGRWPHDVPPSVTGGVGPLGSYATSLGCALALPFVKVGSASW
jgi:hypothetical protein